MLLVLFTFLLFSLLHLVPYHHSGLVLPYIYTNSASRGSAPTSMCNFLINILQGWLKKVEQSVRMLSGVHFLQPRKGFWLMCGEHIK